MKEKIRTQQLSILSYLLFAMSILFSSTSFAFECLHDTSGNNFADEGDTTAGASTNGSSSLACGSDSDAGGGQATALGAFAQADALNSVAVGWGADATTENSTAVGSMSEAVADNSTAIGFGSDATSLSSTALGASARATNGSTTAIGTSTNAIGFRSIAIGAFADATAGSTTAVGFSADAEGESNTVFGFIANAPAPYTNAAAIGARAQVEKSNALVLGSIPGVNSSASFVDVGIGTTQPAAPLHIRRASGSTDASILVEDSSPNTKNRTMLSLVNNGNARIALENTNNGARFEMGTNGNNGNFIFIADGVPIFTLTPNGRVLFGTAFNPTLDVFPNGNGIFRGTVTATDYLMSSDVNEKQDIEEMPGNLVLAKLEQLPVTEWAYKKDPESRHIGPMAQDFKKVFNLGTDETKINPADMAGVSLAAVKAQQVEIKAQQAEIQLQQQKVETLAAENAELKTQLETFEQRFAALEARLIQE